MKYRFGILAILLAMTLAGLGVEVVVGEFPVPGDDSWVDVNNPNSTHDEDNGLQLAFSNAFGNFSPTQIVYLRFETDSDCSATSQVELRLYVESFVLAGDLVGEEVELFSVGDDWNGGNTGLGTENDLSYAFAPTLDSTLGTQTIPAAGNWLTFDSPELLSFVTGEHQGDGLVSLAIRLAGYGGPQFGGGLRLEDRESTLGTGNLPELVCAETGNSDLIINEIIPNPYAVDDSVGEWIELYNQSNIAVDLNGWMLRDDGSDSHTINSSVIVPANGHIVICKSDDASSNGGVTCSYAYGTDVQLDNEGDEVVLVNAAGQEVDRVNYDNGETFPNPTGASMCLTNPDVDNNVGSNWRESTATFGDGDSGTPGEFNYDCFDSTALEGGTGPGGVGTNDGTSGAELWLLGDTGVFEDATCTTMAANLSDVACWQDQSGNSRHLTQSDMAKEPTYRTAIVNGRPVLGFNEAQQDHLLNTTNVALAAGDDTFTYFAVWYPDFANQAVVFEQNSPSAALGKRAALLQLTGFYGFNGESNDAHIVPYTPASWKLTSLLLNGAPSNNVHIYDSGTQYTGSINMTTQNVGTDQMLVGKKRNDAPAEYFDGDMAEIIVFSHNLNTVERILVENYLSASYDLPLSVNDYYDGDTMANGNFDFNVAGIGQESDGSHALSHGGGIIVRDVSFLNDDGDYVLFGRQTTDCTVTAADIPADWVGEPNPAHWGCSFYFDVTDAGTPSGTELVDIAFDYSEAGFTSGDTPDSPVSNYGLLKRSTATGQYTDITSTCVNGGVFISGDRLVFAGVDVSCLGSNFTLGSKDAENSTLPVTLAYANAERAGDAVTIDWQTATETGTVGFNLVGIAADGSLVKLAERITPATGVATVVPQTYLRAVREWGGSSYYIEDIGIRGEVTRHGPFTVGQPSGRLVEPTPIDWPTINTQHATRASERQAAALNAVRQTFTPSLQTTPAAIDVLVNQSGLQRITYADLVAFGIDPAGLPANRLALRHQGQTVPITVLGGNTVGPNTVIEFLGEALDSLYTDTSVYSLTVNPAEALRVGRDTRAVPTVAPVPFYLQTVTVEEENTYSYLAPNGDPWYSAWMMAYGGTYSRDFPLPVDHLTTGADAVLHLDVWGLTDWPVPGDDHRLQVSLNGTLLADVTFDGLVSQLLDITLPAGLLAEGDNTLTLTVPQPADPDVWWDIVILDSYGVTYPRAFVAVDNSLTFTAAGVAFEVDGLTALDGAVYRVSADNTLTRLARAIPTANGDGTYRVKFRGSPEPATYFVSSAGAMATPDLAAAQPFTDITSGSADYLMLAHPDFIDGLTDLATHHATRGLTVKVVDVTDVYAQFSFGVVDPAAIQEYIEHAVTNMGVQYILLVGGDTYDYFDRLGLGSISFIPSLYGPTEPYVSFAPLDPLYADVDGDGVPDVPIGRFPVRTPAELSTVVAKTLAYANAAADQSVLLAADDGFRAHSDSFAATLAGWSTTTAYLDDVSAAAARQTVLDTVNGGVRLTSFLGHSGPVSWTYDGLFSAADAASLTNAAPTVVTQWGCWNTYHVEPLYNTLGHEFMLNEAGGAAAVLGAATLTQTTSDMLLGVRVLPEIVTPGQTLGDGIQAAKADLALTHPNLADVLLGWTLLGDPALQVQP